MLNVFEKGVMEERGEEKEREGMENGVKEGKRGREGGRRKKEMCGSGAY
jgi:hypothetical protein